LSLQNLIQQQQQQSVPDFLQKQQQEAYLNRLLMKQAAVLQATMQQQQQQQQQQTVQDPAILNASISAQSKSIWGDAATGIPAALFLIFCYLEIKLTLVF
jgi:hypothetical protein